MKVILKSQMPDGTRIQINDWSEDYSCFAESSEISTYPIAKMTSKDGFIREGRSFRCGFNFDNADQTLEAFQQLESGEKTLEDFIGNIDDFAKIKYLLGR